MLTSIDSVHREMCNHLIYKPCCNHTLSLSGMRIRDIVGMKFDLINHHFMLEFVDSGLYFVQDENNFIHPLLLVGSGSGSDEKRN